MEDRPHEQSLGTLCKSSKKDRGEYAISCSLLEKGRITKTRHLAHLRGKNATFASALAPFRTCEREQHTGTFPVPTNMCNTSLTQALQGNNSPRSVKTFRIPTSLSCCDPSNLKICKYESQNLQICTFLGCGNWTGSVVSNPDSNHVRAFPT